MAFANWIIIFILVFMATAVLTYITRYYALKNKILDVPNQRSSHVTPTPRGGGLAIVFVFNICLLALWNYFRLDALFAALSLGGIIIAAVGYYDDLFRMKARTRAFIQFATATFALLAIGGLPTLDFGTWQFHVGILGTIIGIISIVWLTNLYNFMDGIDGISGSEGLFVCIAAGTMLWFNGTYQSIAILCFLFASCLAGFTLFNWPPAKIFLGDVGSGFIGYTLAVLGIYTAKLTNLSLSFWIMLLAIFICDATFTVVRRARQGKAWYDAHREHAYQRLIIAGKSHKEIIMQLLTFNLAVILPLAFIAQRYPSIAGWLMLMLVFGLFILWRRIVIQTKDIVTA